jgi:hypothetical protein
VFYINLNYIWQYIHYIVKKYNLDSFHFGFRFSRAKNHLSKRDELYTFKKKDRNIVYERRAYNFFGFRYETIWNNLTNSNIFNKGLYHLKFL